jgi:hypothetical protein
MKTTIYRIDTYGQFGVGDLLGFTTSIDDAEHMLSMAGYPNRINYSPDRNFGQITAFVVDAAIMDDVDIDDNQEVLDELWGKGEIIDTLNYR